MQETFQTVCPQCGATARFHRAMPVEVITCGACGEKLFDGEPIELNGETFHPHLCGNEIPVVVDFWAEWCAPCKIIAPEFVKAAKDMEPQVRFAKVDTDEEQKLAGHNAIHGFPTLVIYKGGREVARHAGAMSAKQIATWLHECVLTGSQ